MISPYLNLYDQLTAEENLKFFSTVSGLNITGKEIEALLVRVGLGGRGMDYVGGYSSGMKQRLKYATALLKNPGFLFLDEPTSNLDDDGKQIVFDIIKEYKPQSIVIIATNDKEDLYWTYHFNGKKEYNGIPMTVFLFQIGDDIWWWSHYGKMDAKEVAEMIENIPEIREHLKLSSEYHDISHA